MGNFIDMLGQQAATGGLGAIMGIATAGWNDKRQMNQQEELQRLQMAGSKEMMDYSMRKQLEMWKATNYAEQVKQMRIAGLNPGLLYGMKGGGGVTTGTPSGTVQGANAPMGGGEIGMGIQMAAQLALLKAQKENIEADTANKQGQAANQPITGRNIEANTELTHVHTKIARLDEWIKDKSKEDAVEIVMWQGQKILEEVDHLARTNRINKATENDQIDIIKAELATKALMPFLIEAQTKTEKGKPAVQQAEIAKMAADVQNEILNRMQRWEALYQQGVKFGDERLNNLLKRDAEEMKVPIDVLTQIAQAFILKGALTPTTVPRNQVGGFHQR